MEGKTKFARAIGAGAMAGVVAAGINTALYYLFLAIGMLPSNLEVDGEALTAIPVIISSIMPSVVGSIVFFLLDRFTKSGMKIFTVTAVIFLLLSFANPFIGIASITVAAGIALNIMHVVVAVMLLIFLRKAKKAAVAAGA